MNWQYGHEVAESLLMRSVQMVHSVAGSAASAVAASAAAFAAAACSAAAASAAAELECAEADFQVGDLIVRFWSALWTSRWPRDGVGPGRRRKHRNSRE